MHVLCVYPWLALGGAEKLNLSMLEQLAARGWSATVVATLPHANPWRAQFERLGPVEALGEHPPADQPRRLAQLVAERRPDAILISNSELGYALLPALRARFPDVAFLDYCHAVDPDSPTGGYPHTSVTLAPMLDLQMVTSEALRGWMIERGGDAGRIHVCTANIDTADWDPARFDRAALRRALGIPEEAFVGLFAARLERVKQPQLAARIMRRVARQAPDARFLVAGDGTYAPFLESYVGWHGLRERVRLLGSVGGERMRELLALSDALLLPSAMEGLSLAVYEAMAMGVVPVSVRAGGQAELVTPECGVLVEHGPGEEEAYVRALLDLARDRGQLCAMGRAARERVASHFRLDQMGDRANALALRALELHASAPRPPVSMAAAHAAEAAAVALAERDAAIYRSAAGRVRTPRSLLRALYWGLVGRGAWWLVPLADRLRRR